VTILRRIFAKPGQFALGAVVCGLFALPAPSVAAPLDKDSCAKLTQDMQNMKMLEVGKLMEKGPSWAASHLTSADLSLVRQYIDLDEQLKFRCSAPSSLVHLKHLDDDEEDGQAKQAGAADGEAKKGQAGDGQEEEASAPAPAAAPAAKPKPKPEKQKAAKAPVKKAAPPREGASAQ
jgi:hypothetical protein